ncbi:hypothetical protein BGW36DRAFT_406503 [Talaromyces proteolyticus]|uniref:Uncharacterized protein n=1 Tax=Talaromyces proteolyticus TaxID=1131652 RepID=A0AAD4KSR9_9EURO|nr:uncharacterized protein BGW36DRAFT_406503 [Talaromyces proteolyticus]KAH8698551.1 hypothetical protein BGW36DRAFT_406503 [Talaromyces proteolyticus]
MGCIKLASSFSGHRCVRWRVAKLSLCRDQSAPWPDWTKRYNSMEAKNITNWANDEIRILQCSHKIKDSNYTLYVRKFVPIAGDMLCETWFDETVGEFKKHDIEPYAVVEMEGLEREMQRYVNENIRQFIIGIVGLSDELLWKTYEMALKRCSDNRVASSSQHDPSPDIPDMPEDICGDEKITKMIDDESSPYNGTYPLAPVIYAQEETVLLTKIQRPLQQRVITDLDALMKANKRENWFTIYLTLFILLHSCSLTSRRDEEFAVQMKLGTQFVNPEAIYYNQTGVTELIKEFHLKNKGGVPFNMAGDPSKHSELAAAAKLEADQIQFLAETSFWVSQRGK